MKLFYDWNWDEAYHCFQKALGLMPGSSEAHQFYAVYLQTSGEYEEAVDEARTAVQLDPLSLPANHTLAQTLLAAERLEEAEEQAQLCLVMDPTFRAATETLGFIRLTQDRPGEALALFEELTNRAAEPGVAAAARGYTYGILGRTADARRMLELLEERSRREPRLSLNADFAVVHMGLGEHDEAFRHLNEAIERRLGFLVFVKHSPIWKNAPITGDPRFQDLMSRVGAPALAPV